MTFTDETLGAYVDGELEEPERAKLEAAMISDASLRQRIDRLRLVQNKLLAAFSGATQESVPPHLLDVLKKKPARAQARRPLSGWNWAEFSAIAATLAVATVLGYFLLRSPDGDFFMRQHGALLARGALAEALATQLASEQTRAAPVRIGISFRARDGDYCRTFAIRSKQPVTGLACRQSVGWQVQVLAQTPPVALDAEPAGSSMPANLVAAIENTIAGEPLDAAGEAAARKSGWGAH